MINQILACCARQEPLPGTAATLKKLLAGFTEWESLLDQAQFHGMAPLLWYHIKAAAITIPARQRQLFKLLTYRYRHANQVRLDVLAELLQVLQQAGIEAVVLKGWVLAVLVYDDIGLRPMRDIDLLLKENDLARAEKVFSTLGFRAELPHHILQDHHHMVPLFKKVDGVTIELELHRRLLPILPQYQKLDFAAVSRNFIHFDLQGVDALSLDFGEMLWYLFMHGFRMPLNYEPFRFMHMADIITLMEKKYDEIDWQRMRGNHPEMLPALALFHQLCPFSETVRSHLELSDTGKTVGAGRDYHGWPRHRLQTVGRADYPGLFMATLFPPPWWLRLYYSDQNNQSLPACWLRHASRVGRLAADAFPSFWQGRLQAVVQKNKGGAVD